MQVLFTVLITLQFVVVVLHDLVHVPGWTHGEQVKRAVGPYKFWIGTAINAIFPALAVGFAIFYWQRPKPSSVVDYWVIYCAITLLSAFVMWYVPYIFGASEKTKRQYEEMYAGTKQVLPPRGENPRPNLLHLLFHALFLVNLCVAVALWFQQRP